MTSIVLTTGAATIWLPDAPRSSWSSSRMDGRVVQSAEMPVSGAASSEAYPAPATTGSAPESNIPETAPVALPANEQPTTSAPEPQPAPSSATAAPAPKPRVPRSAAGAPSREPLAGRRLAWPGERLPASVPVRVEIPAVGISAPIDPLGLNADGSLEVPGDFARAGYYTRRPTPGELGPAVVVAHRGGFDGPGAFWRLPALKPGHLVKVIRADGEEVTFMVERVTQHEKDRFPTEEVYGHVPYAALRLVTCGGPFDNRADHYRDNVIVFARLLR